jgi:hypothetical protein
LLIALEKVLVVRASAILSFPEIPATGRRASWLMPPECPKRLCMVVFGDSVIRKISQPFQQHRRSLPLEL